MTETQGFAAGAVTAIVIAGAFWLTRKMKGRKCEFDERQEAARGRGFKYGFFTLLIYNLIYGALYMEEAPAWCDHMAGVFLGIVLAILVFGIYCIWNDAYLNLNQNPVAVYMIFGGVGGLNVVIGILNIMRGEMITEGRINFRSTNLMCGVLFVVFFFTFLFRNQVNRKMADADCEE